MQVTHGKSRRIGINDNVDLILREVRITEGEGDNAREIRAVELREFLKNAEVEGHGLFVPFRVTKDIAAALGRFWIDG